MYYFNYTYYHLFNVVCNSLIKMYSYSFQDENLSQIASEENHSAFVLILAIITHSHGSARVL